MPSDGCQIWKLTLHPVRNLIDILIFLSEIPIKYANLLPWRRSRMNILFNLEKKVAVPPEKISSEHIESFVPKGGVLADEVPTQFIVFTC